MTNRKSYHLISRCLRPALALMLAGFAVAGCTDKSEPRSKADAENVTIKIFLKPKPYADGALCPHKVNKTNPDVWRGKFVTWQTYLESDHDKIVDDYKFEIYFDPIQGNPLISSNKGQLEKKIDEGAPLAEYKYTIWDRATGNNAHKCEPLDPRFRVN